MVLVQDVAPGTPAEKAGFQKGDTILTAAGIAIGTSRSLVGLVEATEGKPITIELNRSGEVISKTLSSPTTTANTRSESSSASMCPWSS